MPRPRVLILRAPGTNCDRETAFAFEQAGAETTSLHINRLVESPKLFGEFQILCLPGGFSYGDDLAAGRILGVQLRCHLAEHLRAFKDAGKLVLGICNGFQILIQTGLLFDDAEEASSGPAATLTFNDSGKFEDRWIHLRATGGRCIFFRGIESMYLPIAHGEGKFVPRDERILAALESRGQLALRYTSADSTATNGHLLPFPTNPNGSIANVAGVCDATGRVCGLMPHPERHIDPMQHPRWTRGEGGKEGDGLRVFRNAVEFFN
jgi:phosphoribosylformylglycinamidine synthase